MADTSRTFVLGNITADHTIAASFAAAPPVTHVVSASAGPNGKITPSGDITVNDGDSLSFLIEADPGFVVDQVLVDGVAS